MAVWTRRNVVNKPNSSGELEHAKTYNIYIDYTPIYYLFLSSNAQEHNPYTINNDREESSLNSTRDIGSNTGVTAAEVNTYSIEQTGDDNTRNSKLDGATNRTCDRLWQDDHVDKNVPSRDGNGSPFVYLCATMWHENKKEMTKLLTSIFRQNVYYE